MVNSTPRASKHLTFLGNAVKIGKGRKGVSESLRTTIRSKRYGWVLPVIPVVATLALTAAAVRAGEVDLKAAASNYSVSCQDCHGKEGRGDGPKAADLKTAPANYTDCAAMAKLSDDYLFNIIRNGGKSMGKSKDMADFTMAYDDNEIRGLVAYVRSFCKKK